MKAQKCLGKGVVCADSAEGWERHGAWGPAGRGRPQQLHRCANLTSRGSITCQEGSDIYNQSLILSISPSLPSAFIRIPFPEGM